jgi:hypothetical protein
VVPSGVADQAGRSAFYQNALLGFGLHSLGHIGVSQLTHGYTSGVATSPTIVVPFWLWATQVLDQGGVPNRRSVPAAIALAAASVASGHLAASLLTKNRPLNLSATAARWQRCTEPRGPAKQAARVTAAPTDHHCAPNGSFQACA